MEDVDKTIREGLGLRWSFMGPFETIDLNAPGGVVDYIQRYGPMYYEMGQSQAQPREWDEAVATRIERQRRMMLSEDRLQARQAWRDRRLMALAAHKARPPSVEARAAMPASPSASRGRMDWPSSGLPDGRPGTSPGTTVSRGC